MKTPVDIRNENFAHLQSTLSGRMIEVYDAWCRFPNHTTQELASLSGMNILNLRPRTTDLLHLGLVECVSVGGHEGIYRARERSKWETWKQSQLDAALQLTLI